MTERIFCLWPHRAVTGSVFVSVVMLLTACASAPTWMQDVNPLASREPARTTSPEDFVDAQGRCGDANETALTGASLGLGMTECEVARRAGIADRVEITANERGERLVVMSYLSGPRPGIYRFASGRLVSIERAPDATPPSAAANSRKARRKTN